MKELYIAPEVKVIGYVASEKIASEETLGFPKLNLSLDKGIVDISGGDVPFPVSLT